MTPDQPSRPFTAASFNQYLAEGKLMASRCEGCGAVHLPPRAICPACHSANLQWQEESDSATLAAFTVIYVAPSAQIALGYGREKPYLSGIVQTPGGQKISARIEGFDPLQPESIHVGAPLQRVSDSPALTYRAVTEA
jgi:uncharacterized OB-fold protein